MSELGGLLDRIAVGGPTGEQRAAFGRVVRLEWAFWDEVWGSAA